jgi:O-antigen ligase
MKGNPFFSWVFMFSACALLAIGRIYDERLSILDVNLSVIISTIYLFAVLIILFSITSVSVNKTRFIFYFFYFSCLVMTPILWVFFGVNGYGAEKYINFLLIIIPISVVILEKYELKDVFYTLLILVGISCFLALLSIFGLASSDRADGRMAALGGGPIVFARWMGLGLIVLFFMPLKSNKIYKYILLTIFFILALASGSRGPILSLLVTFSIFIVLNFNRVFIKLLVSLLFLISVLFISGAGKQISEIGGFDRVFMNVSKKGGAKQSTGTRMDLALGSFVLFQHYPLGVGAGNWQSTVNEIRPDHLIPLEYPHNLFFEIGNEYGIFVLVILIFTLLFIAALGYNKMSKYRDQTTLYPVLFYLFIFFFLNSLVSGMLNDSRILFVIMSMILINKPLIISENKKQSFLL